MSSLTLVLVHGAGHTADVWKATQGHLVHPSLAVDLPGRRSRPADITTVTVTEAARAIADDVPDGDLVLVGHSIAGTVLPTAAALLGERVRHMVFVAGITAPHGELPRTSFMPPHKTHLVDDRLARWRRDFAGLSLESVDITQGSAVDSLNFGSQPMRWSDVPDCAGRTFVRCTRDPIQSPELQRRLASFCGASKVIDLDSGHTPAEDAPEALAAVLDAVVNGVRPRGPEPAGRG